MENLDDAKDALKKQLAEMKNVEYSDWDSITIELCHGETSRARIRMMRQDMDAMAKMHEVNRENIIGLMIDALEDEYQEKISKTVN
jgi:hypothetical protein